MIVCGPRLLIPLEEHEVRVKEAFNRGAAIGVTLAIVICWLVVYFLGL